jgi:hypothetical protein
MGVGAASERRVGELETVRHLVHERRVFVDRATGCDEVFEEPGHVAEQVGDEVGAVLDLDVREVRDIAPLGQLTRHAGVPLGPPFRHERIFIRC